MSWNRFLKLLFCFFAAFVLENPGVSLLAMCQDSHKDEPIPEQLNEAFSELLTQYEGCKLEVICETIFEGEKLSPAEYEIHINHDHSSVKVQLEKPPRVPGAPHISIEQIFDGKQVLRQQINSFAPKPGGARQKIILSGEIGSKDPYASQAFFGIGFVFGVDESANTTWVSQFSSARITKKETDGNETNYELTSQSGKRQWIITVVKKEKAKSRIVRFEYVRKDFPKDRKELSKRWVVSDISYDDKTGRITSYRESTRFSVDKGAAGVNSYGAGSLIKVNSVGSIEDFHATLKDFKPKIDESSDIVIGRQNDQFFRLVDGKIVKGPRRQK